ncbi:MAG: A/G-specific adenine glycosylase [Thermomicrobiales bacterium]
MKRRGIISAAVSVSVIESIPSVREHLLVWFRANRRDLPWRKTRDPYRILVSEIMLQQTQVDRVTPYYLAFLERFPTIETLAAAPTAEVIRAWAGLGYNRRAVNLQRTAKYVVDELGGVFPSTVEELKKLPGIGPYTAGAVACFAFEQDVGFIDTNIRRVLHRVFFGVDVPVPAATEAHVAAVADAAVPPGHGWEWGQALMEFGALHCTARKPACVVCPLQANCAAFPAIQSALAELPKGVRLKREGQYDGSNRYYRGRVIAALRDHALDDPVPLRTLGPFVRDDFSEEHLPWLNTVVEGLSRDGLAMVAEDALVYDADHDVGGRRVKLP